MAVLLTGVKIRTAKPRLQDFGGELTPGLGGKVQRINRLGTRYALDIELPPVPDEPDGRLLASKLRQAKQEGAMLPFPQPGLVIGDPGSPSVNGAVTGGSTVPMAWLTAGYTVRDGQFFSIIRAGQRYLYASTADVTADGAGHASVPIFPMLRTPLAGGETIEMAVPMIEGLLQGDVTHSIMLEPYFGFSISIEEAE